MTFYVENETNIEFPFSPEEIGCKVATETLLAENCPYEAEINLLLTDNDGIKAYNKEYRGIDQVTDVLSFPNVDYSQAGDFSLIEGNEEMYCDLDSGELLLGDIMISISKVQAQAEEYGHSLLREFAFLITHSMLHLLGYDHMDSEEAIQMEVKQEEILRKVGITRD